MCVCVCVYSPERLVEWLVIALTRQVHVLAPGNVVLIRYVIVDGQLRPAIELTLTLLISEEVENKYINKQAVNKVSKLKAKTCYTCLGYGKKTFTPTQIKQLLRFSLHSSFSLPSGNIPGGCYHGIHHIIGGHHIRSAVGGAVNATYESPCRPSA